MAYRITYVFLVAVTAAVIAGNSRAQQAADSQAPIDDSQTTANAHHVLLRQKWQSAGRKLARTNSAALRAQAIRQKLQMRTAPALNVAANTGAWVSLGPKPLPSDASGTGLQDYGFVSGRATAVAIDPNDLSGNTVYAGPGRFPSLSPDGRRLAFVNRERLSVRSLVDGTTVELLAGTRVMGAGAWSPNGRFIVAGAWTKLLALEKRQIIIDTTTDSYAVIGKLGEGDYGEHFIWISRKLLTAPLSCILKCLHSS